MAARGYEFYLRVLKGSAPKYWTECSGVNQINILLGFFFYYVLISKDLVKHLTIKFCNKILQNIAQHFQNVIIK